MLSEKYCIIPIILSEIVKGGFEGQRVGRNGSVWSMGVSFGNARWISSKDLFNNTVPVVNDLYLTLKSCQMSLWQ